MKEGDCMQEISDVAYYMGFQPQAICEKWVKSGI